MVVGVEECAPGWKRFAVQREVLPAARSAEKWSRPAAETQSPLSPAGPPSVVERDDDDEDDDKGANGGLMTWRRLGRLARTS